MFKKRIFLYLIAVSIMFICSYASSQETLTTQDKISIEEQKDVDDLYNRVIAFNEMRNENASNVTIPILNKKEITKLKPEVRALYDKTIFFMDRVNYDSALECLKTAVMIQPETIKFRLAIIDIYILKARLNIGDKSIEFYGLAEKEIESILNQQEAKDSQIEQAQNLLKDIKKERENIPVRDDRRKSLYDKMVESHYVELYGEDLYTKNKEKALNPQSEINTTMPGVFNSSSVVDTSASQPGQQGQPLPPMGEVSQPSVPPVAPLTEAPKTAGSETSQVPPFSDQSPAQPAATAEQQGASPFSQTNPQTATESTAPATGSPAQPPAEQQGQQPVNPFTN